MKPRVDIKLDLLQKRQKINKNQKKKKNESKTYMGQSRIWALEGSIFSRFDISKRWMDRVSHVTAKSQKKEKTLGLEGERKLW